MVKILDSYHGNSLEMASKIFAEIKSLPTPQVDNYLSFLLSTGRQELSIYENQAICGVLMQSNFAKFLGLFG